MKFTIVQARTHRGLSQEDMAKKLGMSRSSYIDHEKGKQYFRVDQAYRFSVVTQIPVENIIFFENELHLKC